MQIIVTGHAPYATSIKENINLFMKTSAHLTFIDIDTHSSDAKIKATFEAALKEDEQAIFFCDILGGASYQVARRMAKTNPNLVVITGCNIGGLLEVTLRANWWEGKTEQVAREIIGASEAGIQLYRARPHQF